MFHPAKPWKMGLTEILNIHNVTRYVPDAWGGMSVTPVDLFSNPGGAWPLKGAFSFVRDQRASGMNAVLWRDPSMIL